MGFIAESVSVQMYVYFPKKCVMNTVHKVGTLCHREIVRECFDSFLGALGQ